MGPLKMECRVDKEVSRLLQIRDEAEWSKYLGPGGHRPDAVVCGLTGECAQSVEAVPSSQPTFEAFTQAGAKAAEIAAWATAEARTSPAASDIRRALENLWVREHLPVTRPVEAPHAGPKPPANLSKCLREFRCLCVGDGPDLKAVRNSTYVWLKKCFPKQSDRRELLVNGSVVIAVCPSAHIPGEAAHLAGDGGPHPSSLWKFLHISMMYFNPYRATCQPLEWMSASSGGYLELRAKRRWCGVEEIAAEIGLGEETLDIKFFRLFDSPRGVGVFDPSILTVEPLPCDAGAERMQIWPRPRRGGGAKRPRGAAPKRAPKKRRGHVASPPPDDKGEGDVEICDDDEDEEGSWPMLGSDAGSADDLFLDSDREGDEADDDIDAADIEVASDVSDDLPEPFPPADIESPDDEGESGGLGEAPSDAEVPSGLDVDGSESGSGSSSESNSSSSSSAALADPAPVAVPAIAAEGALGVVRDKIADEFIVPFGSGELRFYWSKAEIYAVCKDPRHKDVKCLRVRTVNPSIRKTPAALGQGRPLGYLSAWLSHDCETGVEHRAYVPSFEDRAVSRLMLKEDPASVALLLEERPRRDDEDSEPERL